ncbi:MAG: hypothetical protein PF518_01750 [Spirochaetaceae bacterium]|jgi:DNA-binding MarR family transcriptional regulator|nr:hypothetical protein [Spirochaetaceae bacterium]
MKIRLAALLKKMSQLKTVNNKDYKMNSKTKNKLLVIFKKYIPEKKPNEKSQMCLIWSTEKSPDILTETDQMEDLETVFNLDFSEDEAIQIYDMTIAEAAIYIDEIINKSRKKTAQIPKFTQKQGQYLSFIYYYTKLNRRAPAEADIQHYFKVSAPTVHQMVVKLVNISLISKESGIARSIQILIAPDYIPQLE